MPRRTQQEWAASRLWLAVAVLLALAAAPRGADALTFANQTQILLKFKEDMLKLGPNWAGALQVRARGSYPGIGLFVVRHRLSRK